jgi:N-acetylmuramoyl-L-alanine amidase
LRVQSVVSKPRSWVIAALVVCLCAAPLVQGGSAQTSYRVQAGDTLTAIAGQYGVSIETLVQLNQLANPDLIIVGQQLAIPGSAPPTAETPYTPPVTAPTAPGTGGGSPSYAVKSGDTLSGIAESFGVTVADLVSANGIVNPDLIVVGQTLAIPGASPAESDETPASPSVPAPATVSREEVRAMIFDAAEIHGEDPYLMMALAWRESGWRQNVVSSAGALGIMQLMPTTAEWAGPALVGREVDAAGSAWDNIETGVAFYAYLYSLTEDDYFALAGYYQGLYSVRTSGFYPDTVQYVENILEMREQFVSGQLP